MAYDIEVRKLAPQPAVAIHYEIPLAEIPNVMQQAIPGTWSYAEAHGGGPTRIFARYDNVEAQRVVFDVGVILERRIDGEGDVQATELQGGDAAHTLHVGPYEAMAQAYAALEQWMRENGRVPAGAPWEVYLSDPAEEPDPQKWRTEIFWPIT